MPDATSSLQERLVRLYQESTPQEQEALLAIFTAASEQANRDVQGFTSARQSLLTSILTNIANMKHESLKGIAQNLRG